MSAVLATLPSDEKLFQKRSVRSLSVATSGDGNIERNVQSSWPSDSELSQPVGRRKIYAPTIHTYRSHNSSWRSAESPEFQFVEVFAWDLASRSVSEVIYGSRKLVAGNDGAEFIDLRVERPAPAKNDLSSKWERVFIELDMLVDDDEFMAPTQTVIGDLELLASILPSGVDFPSVEHDSSSGHVSLSWFKAETGATFSISLLGSNRAFGAYINPLLRESRPFRNLSIRGRSISDVFDDPAVRDTTETAGQAA